MHAEHNTNKSVGKTVVFSASRGFIVPVFIYGIIFPIGR
jgi:hypothetical protein